MKQIADLHIHSRYSRATSKEGIPEYLDLWARKKGISIVGTGDFTHPAWRKELDEKLVPAEDGLYVLKEDCVLGEASGMAGKPPRFVVTGEISSIYKKNGKVRKVHNMIILPGLEDAERLSSRLEEIGNIHSDGRPILGLDCRDLLEIMLETCPGGMLVPAHIWTPHFSLFGAFSGFDTMEECFEDLTDHIHAVETGLSSDPPMNWRLSALDHLQLISNSDAHSPAKLGREANLLDIEISYAGLKKAVEQGEGLDGTIEFFPEEGKYHFDGHRKCHICLSPLEAEKYGGKCPVCGRKLTIGVDHRIVQLADRKEGFIRENAKTFESLVPLPEVISSSTGYSAASKKVQNQYEEMLGKLGSEFEILREIPVEDIRKESGYLVSEGIRRLRAGEVIRRPGFDGEYGTIKLFEPDEIQNPEGQISLFAGNWSECQEEKTEAQISESTPDSVEDNTNTVRVNGIQKNEIQESKIKVNAAQEASKPVTLNVRQQEAVEAIDCAVAVIAGPGTGKTKTLVSRILYLLEHRKVKPSEITAVTFTNKAAAEMQERLTASLGGGRSIKKMHIGTFHALCLDYLKKKEVDFVLAGQEEILKTADGICKEYHLSMAPGKFLQEVSRWKTKIKETNVTDDSEKENKEFTIGDSAYLQDAMEAYQKSLQERHWMDFDDLLIETLRIFESEKQEKSVKKSAIEQGFSYLLVDEFQDISPQQYALIKAWNRDGKELFVIGDPDQSIYGFRGSDAHCFERLQQEYAGLRTITLEENYRSCGQILSAATAVISNNPGKDRYLRPFREEGLPVRVVRASGKMAEAVFTAKEINRLIGGIDMIDTEQRDSFREEKKTWAFKDIAILYRTHHQARILEKCLSQEGIPYITGGREDFLLSPLVRGTIAFFRSLAETEKEEYKKLSMEFLWEQDEEKRSASMPAANHIYEQMAEKYAGKWKRMKPKKLVETWIKDLNCEGEEALEKLAHMAACYENTAEFIDAIILGEEGDLSRCSGKNYQADAVRLMTLHGSKGLEFPVVILFGMGEGELPLENEKYPTDTEEERRLFYVGMTRAKEELILTCAGKPSPFLSELPEENVENITAEKKHIVETSHQMSLFEFI